MPFKLALPPSKIKTVSRNPLHGTGLTKAAAKQAERDHKRFDAQTATSRLAVLDGKQTQSGQFTLLHAPALRSGSVSVTVMPVIPTAPAAPIIGELLPSQTEPALPPQAKVVSLPTVELADTAIADHILPDNLMGDIVLDADQRAAVSGICQEQYSVLIGAAGTGKTTTTKAIVQAIEKSIPTIDLNNARTERYRKEKPDYNVAIAFCAFTGRAVQQMKRALPIEYHPMCDTIHAMLGYTPVDEDYLDPVTNEWRTRKMFRPTFTETNKLPYKVVYMDEAGMTPIYLWNEVIAALPTDCRIVLIGDINQLPPVQGRSVLGFAMLQWPTFALTKVHRTAEDNAIIQNAHRILNGKYPIADKKTFFIQDMPGGSLETLKITLGIIQKLHKAQQFDPFIDGLIVPQNKSTIGQLELNHSLVGYFNQVQYDDKNIPLNPRVLIKAGYVTCNYAVGDKIMLLNNDRPLGLTNGMIGVVQEISLNAKFKGETLNSPTDVSFDDDFNLEELTAELNAVGENETPNDKEDARERQASHIMTVKFQNVDEEISFSSAGSFNKLAHAYAFTCHKSQGGEYPTVVVLLHSINIKMLSREWLYTAITRAKEKLILLCNRRGLIHALNTQRVKGNTMKEKAESFIKLMDDSDTTLPNLPAPCKVAVENFEGVA